MSSTLDAYIRVPLYEGAARAPTSGAQGAAVQSVPIRILTFHAPAGQAQDSPAYSNHIPVRKIGSSLA